MSAVDASGTLKEGTVRLSAPQRLAVSQRSLPEFLVKNICLPQLQLPSGHLRQWCGARFTSLKSLRGERNLWDLSTEVLSFLFHIHSHPVCNKTSSFAQSSSLSASRKQSLEGTVLKGSAGPVPLVGADSEEAMVPPLILNIPQRATDW